MIFQKWHGAGNDFLLADNRDGSIALSTESIVRLCNRHTGIGADGVILLETSQVADFKMVFYNPDGSTGMFCGNGGRCIVAYALSLGIKPSAFEAPDGIHNCSVLDVSGNKYSISLGMRDVEGYFQLPDGKFFLNTGTRHLVCFTDNLEKVDVASRGAALRYDKRFAPEGVNVNFVQVSEGVLNVRTYEKGVEAETLACGTGVVASAIAAYLWGLSAVASDGERHSFLVKTAIAELTVEFSHHAGTRPYFSDVVLKGPAESVATVIVEDFDK